MNERRTVYTGDTITLTLNYPPRSETYHAKIKVIEVKRGQAIIELERVWLDEHVTVAHEFKLVPEDDFY